MQEKTQTIGGWSRDRCTYSRASSQCAELCESSIHVCDYDAVIKLMDMFCHTVPPPPPPTIHSVAYGPRGHINSALHSPPPPPPPPTHPSSCQAGCGHTHQPAFALRGLSCRGGPSIAALLVRGSGYRSRRYYWRGAGPSKA